MPILILEDHLQTVLSVRLGRMNQDPKRQRQPDGCWVGGASDAGHAPAENVQQAFTDRSRITKERAVDAHSQA